MKSKIYSGLFILALILGLYPFVKTGYELRGNSYKSDNWLHSVSILEKFKIYQQQYENFEVSVVCKNSGSLEAISSDNDKTNIKLEGFFSEMRNNNVHLWIDLKNINEENKVFICEKLDSLCAIYEVEKQRLVIETRDWQSLSYLTSHNFYTSFFLDINAKDFNEEEAMLYGKMLREITDKGYVKALSFYSENYSFVRNLDIQNIDLMRWEDKKQNKKLPVYYRSCRLDDDENVKVILMNDKCEI